MQRLQLELIVLLSESFIILLVTGDILFTFVCILFSVLFYKYVFNEGHPPKPTATGVMRFAESGDIEGLKKELDKGLNINTRDENNCTLLHWAAANSRVEMVEFLIKNGIEIDATNNHNYTALHITTSRDLIDVTRVLVEYGADKDITTKDNKTALELAKSNPMKILLQIPLFHTYFPKARTPDAVNKPISFV